MESKTEARREGAEAPYETKEEEARSATARWHAPHKQAVLQMNG